MWAGTLAMALFGLCAADGEARRAVEQGLSLLAGRDNTEAEKKLRAGLSLAEAAGDSWALAEAHRGLGVIGNARADYRQARADLTAAVELHGRSPEPARWLAQARNDLAFTEWASGNADTARRLYEQALAGFESTGDAKGRAKVLYNLAFLTHSVEERLRKRIPATLGAARDVGDRALEGKTHHLAGDTWHRAGDFRAALGELEQALALLDRPADLADRARVFNSMCRLYATHGRLEPALEYVGRALELQRKLDDRQGVAYSLGMIASAHLSLGAFEKARGAAAEAVEVARRTSSKTLLSGALTNLGYVQIRQKRYAEAMELLEESLKSSTDYGGRTRARMVQACLESGRVEDAIRHGVEAVRLAQESKAGADVAQAHYWRAKALDRAGRRGEAIADVRHTLEWQEKLRTSLIPTDYLKRGYHEGNVGVSGFAVDLLFRQGLVEESLAVAERSRARAFLDLLAGRALEERSQPGGASPKSGQDEPPIASLAAAPLPTVQGLREAAARDRSTILTYWWGGEGSFVWAVTPEGTVRGARIEARTERVVELIRAASTYTGEASFPARGSRPGEGGRRPGDARRVLYDLLVAPVAEALAEGGKITVVPHGGLHRLSFAALEDAHGRYLIEKHALSYLPAGSLLRFVARGGGGTGQSLVVADPRNTPPGPEGKPLSRLPGAGREAREVAKAVGGRVPAAVFTGDGAMEAAVREQVKDKRVVHFATHGILLDQRPFESYLALGSGGGQDGRLTASEIYGLKMGADLVVLSACRTADGELTGDGIVGLTRAFFYAGASSLLATLWDVADEPSRQLIARFYSHYGRMGKSEALRAAQLETIQALRSRRLTVNTPLGVTSLPEHPIFWAGYILLGEP